MGILSRLGFRRSAPRLRRWSFGQPEQPRNLIRYRYDDPKLAEAERGAAEDIAAVEENEKYFDRDTPAREDEGL
jgi:hypothetical protein